MKWISVEEKLPEKSCIVLCYGIRANGRATMQMANFFEAEGDFDMEDQSFNQKPRVTHWMIPDPPEVSAQNEDKP